MRFLCLHGMGTNSKIFEMQTAAIRYNLGGHHTFEYIDGAVPTDMAPGVSSIADESQEFLQYFDTTYESALKAAGDLETFLKEEGPFDGLMAFSQGAGLAAALMIQRARNNSRDSCIVPLFRCAIFFSGGVPEDIEALQDSHRRPLSFERDGELIHIPTANIWGAHDTLYPHFGPVLSKLCQKELREDFIHEGGHEIPGAKDTEGMLQALKVIKRTIERANIRQ